MILLHSGWLILMGLFETTNLHENNNYTSPPTRKEEAFFDPINDEDVRDLEQMRVELYDDEYRLPSADHLIP